jgi:hypothetical protein
MPTPSAWRSVALLVLAATPAFAPSALFSQQFSRIEGIVVDSLQQPVSFAYVGTSAGPSSVSGLDGHFVIRDLRALGPISIAARRIGYRPVTRAFYIDSTRVLKVRLVMPALPSQLSAVEVHEQHGYDEYLDRSGYYRRVAKSISGTFIGTDAIDKRNPSELTAMLSNIPGVRVERYFGKRGKGSYVMGRGGQCVLGLVVDGQLIETSGPTNEAVQARIPAIVNGARVSATSSKSHGGDMYPSIDETVPVDMIGAIEVYPTAASVPNEFHMLTDACGLIVVWTRYQK